MKTKRLRIRRGNLIGVAFAVAAVGLVTAAPASSSVARASGLSACGTASARCIYGLPHPSEIFGPASNPVASSGTLQGERDGWYNQAVSLGKSTGTVVLDGRSPDTKDAAFAAKQASLAPVDGRSPDTKDAADTARYRPVSIVQGGFNWGDFGIGMAAAFGGLLLLAGLGAGLREARQLRHRLGNA